MTKTEIIRRLKYMRKQAGFNAKNFCKELGVNDSYVSRLEVQQDFLPSWDVFFKMLDLCDVSAATFFSDDYGKVAKHQEVLDSFDDSFHIQGTAYEALRDSLTDRQKELVKILLGGLI